GARGPVAHRARALEQLERARLVHRQAVAQRQPRPQGAAARGLAQIAGLEVMALRLPGVSDDAGAARVRLAQRLAADGHVALAARLVELEALRLVDRSTEPLAEQVTGVAAGLAFTQRAAAQVSEAGALKVLRHAPPLLVRQAEVEAAKSALALAG